MISICLSFTIIVLGNPLVSPTYKPFVPLETGCSVESVKFQVYARSQTDISFAFDEIKKFIENNITTKRVEHEKLVDVVQKHWDELNQLVKDSGLRLTVINPTTVSIQGMLNKVVEAKDKLIELIEEEQTLNQLIYISKNVQWYYHDLRRGEIAYSAILNGKIELAHMNGKKTVEISEADGQQYDVDVIKKVARNKRSGESKTLIRKLIASSSDSGMCDC